MSPVPVNTPALPSVAIPLPTPALAIPQEGPVLSSSASTVPATSAATSEAPLYVKLLTAGTAACVADVVTFPLDTAKVRLQVQGEGAVRVAAAAALQPGGGAAGAAVFHPHEAAGAAARRAVTQPQQMRYKGLVHTISTMARQEGARSLYNGLSAGLQRQMCFASVRLGLYDSTKALYQQILDGGKSSHSGGAGSVHVGTRIAAGFTTGALAVLLAQPTDVVKVRFQAAQRGSSSARYKSTLSAYRTIAAQEGARGLWKGTFPNVGRNAIVNVSEIVCYDIIKETILKSGMMTDNVPCHFTSAVVAGFCTTVFASPVDVVKTRYMNSAPGTYKGAMDCAVRMFMQEGPAAFYKGFTPSFYRLVSWNIVLWITYEQFKIAVEKFRNSSSD